MNKNRGNGYTITEVLIVIAISSAMFIIATVAFSGRQQQVQFDQAVRDLESQLRDIVNDVATGYYPSNDSFDCDIQAAEASPPQISQTGGDANPIGNNSVCLFVGKALHFQDPSFNERFSDFRIFNLVGKRYLSNQPPLEIADEISEVKPVTRDFLETTRRIKYGVQITKVVQPNTGATPADAREHDVVVFLANFEGGAVINPTNQSQNVKIAGINTSLPYGRSESDAITTINNITDTDPSETNGYADFRNRNGVILCLDDGAGRVASIEIGNAGAETTNLRIGNGNIAEECA